MRFELLARVAAVGHTNDQTAPGGPAFLEIPIDVLAGKVDMEKVGVPRFRDYRVASAAGAGVRFR